MATKNAKGPIEKERAAPSVDKANKNTTILIFRWLFTDEDTIMNIHTGPLKGGLPFKAIDPNPLFGPFPSIGQIQDVIFGIYVRNAGLFYLYMYEWSHM